MTARVIYVNGKFAAQRMTGVQRVATELVGALDGLVEGRWELLLPAGAPVPRLKRIRPRQVGPAGLPLHVWEQSVLPVAARAGLLLNLAGSAPWLPSGQVCTLHDAAVFDHPEAYSRRFVQWYATLFRWQARRAALLLTVSEFSRARLALHLGIAPGRIVVLGNGSDHLRHISADDACLDRLGLRGKPFLLAVASDNPTKNIAGLVAAFATLTSLPEVRLVLVGGPSPAVFASVAELAADPRVVRAGALGDDALVALYRHAMALVFPSVYEGFGLPPLEAMSCGCPAVVARAAAIPEVCGEAALYVEPGCADALAAALHAVLTDAALRDRLRQAGNTHVQAFRWRDSAVALQAAVEAIA
jgi:glycosyltransferase involved in cell wall biosynthesis